MNATMVRKYMIAAHNNNITNGENVYFALDIFRNTLIKRGWNASDADDGKAKSAFRSLLVLGLMDRSDTASYHDFMTRMDFTDANKPPADQLYYMMTHHDAILLPSAGVKYYDFMTGDAVSPSKAQPMPIFTNNPPTDPYNAVQWLRSFSDTPQAVQNGFVLADVITLGYWAGIQEQFDIYDMTDVENGTFSKVFEYRNVLEREHGTRTFIPKQVGCTLNQTAKVDWANENNTVPLNKPLCGYTNEFCQVIPGRHFSILVD